MMDKMKNSKALHAVPHHDFYRKRVAMFWQKILPCGS